MKMETPINERIILDLCGGTGSWSKPYADAGYDVQILDPMVDGTDVRAVEYIKARIWGILAAPPCTVFSSAGAWVQRSRGEILEALSIMDACLRIIFLAKRNNPDMWWALENPVGRMRSFLGPPRLIFNPCDYGDPWTKKTLIWGDFILPQKSPVRPLRFSEQGSWTQRLGGKGAKTKRLRSTTPPGFSGAFFEVNP